MGREPPARGVIVGRAGEIGPGERKLLEVAGRSIGIFNLDGEYFAVRNRCPHQGGPLCSGYRISALSGDAPGHYRREREGEIIRCPWHGWEFDIRTGASWFDPQRQRVRTYPIRIEPAPQDATLTAETYPVHIDDGYLVVELGS